MTESLRASRFDELLSTQQVADRLGITRNAVMALDHVLRPVRYGAIRMRYYEPNAIDRYAAARDAAKGK